LRIPFGIVFLITVPVFYAKSRFFQNAGLLGAGLVYPGLVRCQCLHKIILYRWLRFWCLEWGRLRNGRWLCMGCLCSWRWWFNQIGTIQWRIQNSS